MTLTRERARIRRRPRWRSSSVLRNLWTEVTAETSDGAGVRVDIEFTRETVPGESSPETSDAIATDAVEHAVRSQLESSPASRLPTPGARLKQVERKLVPHVVLDNVVVVTSDLATRDAQQYATVR